MAWQQSIGGPPLLNCFTVDAEHGEHNRTVCCTIPAAPTPLGFLLHPFYPICPDFFWQLSLFIPFSSKHLAHVFSATLWRQLMWRSCCSTEQNLAASANPDRILYPPLVRDLLIWKNSGSSQTLQSGSDWGLGEWIAPLRQPGFLLCLLYLSLPSLGAAERKAGGNHFPTRH